jgi:hypothetical protein
VATVALPARPGRAELDPVLTTAVLRRVLVAGTDADLAAVLRRLLRIDQLGVEVAYVPAERSSPPATAWGLPTGAVAAALATGGAASRVPLIRDDAGGVLGGRAEIAARPGRRTATRCSCCAGPRRGSW